MDLLLLIPTCFDFNKLVAPTLDSSEVAPELRKSGLGKVFFGLPKR